MRRSVKRFGIVLVALIAGLAGAYLIYQGLAYFFPGEESPSAAERAVIESSPEVIEVLERDFPEDYVELLASFEAMFEAGATQENVPELLVDNKRLIVRKYAGVLSQAPDKDIRTWIAAVSDSVEQLYEQEGAETCSRFSAEGVPALFELGLAEKYTPVFDHVDALLLNMIAQARSAPEPHNEVTAEDSTALVELMRESGTPEEHLAIVFNSDLQNPDFCPAILAYFAALNSLEGDAGMRVRAGFAQSAGR